MNDKTFNKFSWTNIIFDNNRLTDSLPQLKLKRDIRQLLTRGSANLTRLYALILIYMTGLVGEDGIKEEGEGDADLDGEEVNVDGDDNDDDNNNIKVIFIKKKVKKRRPKK